MNFFKENKLLYHLNKATMYMMFADKYKYIDPILHEKYYKKYLKHLNQVEAYYKGGKPGSYARAGQEAGMENGRENMAEGMPPHNVHIRLVHASPDAPAVDIYANGVRIAQNIGYAQATEYLPIPARTYKIDIFPAGADPADRPILSKTLRVDAGRFYTVAAIGKLANLNLLGLMDQPNPAPGKAKVRFVHLSPDAPAVDIAVAGGPILFRNVSFGQATRYIEVPPGTVNIEVRLAGTNQTVLTIPNVRLRENTVSTMLAIGLVQGQPSLDTLVLVDNP